MLNKLSLTTNSLHHTTVVVFLSQMEIEYSQAEREGGGHIETIHQHILKKKKEIIGLQTLAFFRDIIDTGTTHKRTKQFRLDVTAVEESLDKVFLALFFVV